jgi:hypothetical protein
MSSVAERIERKAAERAKLASRKTLREIEKERIAAYKEAHSAQIEEQRAKVHANHATRMQHLVARARATRAGAAARFQTCLTPYDVCIARAKGHTQTVKQRIAQVAARHKA